MELGLVAAELVDKHFTEWYPAGLNTPCIEAIQQVHCLLDHLLFGSIGWFNALHA